MPIFIHKFINRQLPTPYFQLSIGLLVLSVVISFGSCSKESVETERIYNTQTIPYFINNPLPQNTNQLRVLAIGNSYTEDATAYMQELMDGVGIPRDKYCIYMVYCSASSLEVWANKLNNNSVENMVLRAGNLLMPYTTATLSQLLSLDWDVIVLQQVSYLATSYESLNPHLHELIDGIRRLCPNRRVTLAWNMVHAYSDDYSGNSGLQGMNRWRAISNVTWKMRRLDGIDLIIPTGTAIQNARFTSLNNLTGLTRDHTHLCFGAGRQIAALTWIGSLISPVFSKNLREFTTIHTLLPWEITGEGVADFVAGSTVEVTKENNPICIGCAYYATQSPFRCVQVDNEGYFVESYP